MKSISYQLKPLMMAVYMTAITAGMGNISCSLSWEPGFLKGRGTEAKESTATVKKPNLQMVSPMQAINSKFF